MSDRPIVGGDILRLITAGMYDDPLVLFREYLQNAADSIAARGEGTGSVYIDIDPLEACITITDDGPGLSPEAAVGRLLPIGNSTKEPTVDRGLRGVGRLSSLAFAESVHFTTRTSPSDPVTRVSWSGHDLRDPRLQELDAASAIKECTTIHRLPDDDWPDQFFQVAVKGVTRHAASVLLNRERVRRYIGEVCPVPMSSSFPLAADIAQFLAEHACDFALEVRIGGDDQAVRRPFGPAIAVTDSYSATYDRLERRLIPRLDDDSPAAILWLAHTPYAGSIPRQLGVRGLRARCGNIQVGADDVFRHLFTETRFNGWCVGEMHITDSRIVPNGRRDYFEPGPHLRNLENHVGAIAHELSGRCRRASSYRNRLRQTAAEVSQAKRALDLAQSGYLRRDDAVALLKRVGDRVRVAQKTLDQFQLTLSDSDGDVPSVSDFKLGLEDALPSLGLACSAEVVDALQSAFAAIADATPPDHALTLIETIIRRFARPASCPSAAGASLRGGPIA